MANKQSSGLIGEKADERHETMHSNPGGRKWLAPRRMRDLPTRRASWKSAAGPANSGTTTTSNIGLKGCVARSTARLDRSFGDPPDRLDANQFSMTPVCYTGLEFAIRSPTPENDAWRRSGPPKVPGEPSCAYALLSDPGEPDLSATRPLR
jgi:hypothetical protein